MRLCQNAPVCAGRSTQLPRLRHAAVRAARRAAALVIGVLLVAGCGAGSAPEKIGPQGIDELTVPTPSADPADFQTEPRSRWLPTGTSAIASGGGVALTQTRLADEKLAGIVVVPVEISAGDQGALRRWYAVDQAGNVWVMGERSTGLFGNREWRAGEDAARPGLLIPRRPRRGDGYLRERVPGGPRDRVTTLRVAQTDPDFQAACDGCVELEVSTVEGRLFQETFAPGGGLIRLEPVNGWPSAG